MTADEQGPCAVPLTELLRKIPSAQRLMWTEEDGLKATHYVPVGRYAHEAADEIERLRTELAAVREDAVETVQFWSDYVSEYFREKHDLKTDIERLRGTVTR